jgi:uncharacterized protein (TIGR03435 family)
MACGLAGLRLQRSSSFRWLCSLCAAVLLTSAALRCFAGQATETVQPMAKEAHPSFEVATIKVSDPADQKHRFEIHGHRIILENQTVQTMIEMSYGVHARQIANAPSWAESQRFDVEGLPDVEGQPNVAQFQEMVRKLLEERFALKFHTDKREMPRYVLTVAKDGPKMEPTKSAPDALPNERGTGDSTSRTLQMENVSMGEVAHNLQGALDRPVVDETGLKGKYDFTLRWLREDAPVAADSDSNLPPLFTALQEQLGLKVEPSKGDVEMMVIDHVTQPSAD